MKALKITVVGLVLLVGVLLWTIRRLTHQAVAETQETALAPVAAPAPVQAPEPAATPAPPAPPPDVVTPPAPEKPSPLRGAKRPVTQPRAPQAPAAPAPAVNSKPAAAPPPPAQEAPPAPTAEAPRPPPPAAQPVPPPPPAPRRATIPAGARLVVRTQNTLSTERNFGGDTFVATLDEPLVVEELVIAEKGSEVEGRIVRSEKAGRVEGLSSLAIELVRLHTADGQKLSIATNLHEVQGERGRGSDAKKVGVGAGLGAIIGAIAGGGKGAAIGAGVGAGAGAGAAAATRGQPAVIPAESRLSFQIKTPLEVTERR